MTAPPRTSTPAGRTRTQTSTRESGRVAAALDRASGGRARSGATLRAYARRAQRSTDGGPGTAADRRQGSAHRASFVILVMLLLTGGVVATLWFATQATADAYKLEQARNETSRLAVRVGQLQQEVAQQGSPQSLAQRAARLGMIPAGDIAHLVVGPDGRVTVIGTPTKAVPPPPPPPPATSTPAAPAAPTSGAAGAGSTTPATPPSGG
jgi:hypothetical protein